MPGADRPDQRSNAKHRDAIFSRLTARILRETRDEPSLIQSTERARHDPEVQGDPVLFSMLQAYQAERQAELRSAQAERERDEARFRTDIPTQPENAEVSEDVLRSCAVADHARLAQSFRHHVAHLNELEARDTYARLCSLIDENAKYLPGASTVEYAQVLQRLASRRQEFQQHVDDVAKRIVRAASEGETPRVARLMHRLASIHATHPRLLSEDRLQELREEIVDASETREHRAAALALVERERAVAAEIRHLSRAVHDFHKTAAREPHDSDAYHAAEQAYHQAVHEVETHDKEWLAGFVLELADLLYEWHEPPPETDGQIDRFLQSVRSSLAHVREEIRAIEREGKGQGR